MPGSNPAYRVKVYELPPARREWDDVVSLHSVSLASDRAESFLHDSNCSCAQGTGMLSVFIHQNQQSPQGLTVSASSSLSPPSPAASASSSRMENQNSTSNQNGSNRKLLLNGR